GIDISAIIGTEKLSTFSALIQILQRAEALVATANVDAPLLDCAHPPADIDPATCGDVNTRRPTLKTWSNLYLESLAKGQEVKSLLKPFAIKVPGSASTLVDFTVLINAIDLIDNRVLLFDMLASFR